MHSEEEGFVMNSGFLRGSALLLTLTLAAFTARPIQSAPLRTSAYAQALHAQELWQAHLTQTLSTGRLQKGCAPFLKKARTPRQGTVLLFHGYTACPQQYEGLSEDLAKRGYDVYVPLLPGHGRRYLNPHLNTFSGKGDDIALMPGQYELERYYAFSEHMSQLLMSEPLERVVGGLSLGASLAVHSLYTFPHLAQRGFLISPLFDVAAPARSLVPFLAPLLPYQRISWGDSCEHERNSGRAGYCEFSLTHVSAVQKLGNHVLAKLTEVQQPVQIVGVEQDGAASNPAIAEAHQRLPHNHTCLFQKGVSHSMLSPQDNPTREMFWLPALTDQLLRFVTTGDYFDTGQASEEGLPRCNT
jgi:esterase/lipase